MKRGLGMMKRLLAVLELALVAAMPLMAATETVGGYTWTYRINGDTAEIQSGITPTPTGALTIPSTLGGKTVTSIGSYSFSECSELTNVTIGNSVRSIGDYAFYYCRSLTSVTIPNGVTSIGEYAFCNCSGLASITIPTSVTSIGAWAFAECNWVITLYISDLMAWCKSLPGGVVMNPHGGVNLYLNGNKVTTLTIPGSVTSIKSYAFYCFNGLTSVTIPDSVTSIGSAAFSHCKDLTSVKIGNGVKSIGDEAFYYCSGLTNVTIGNSATRIGAYAFCECRRLASVIFKGNALRVGNSAFSYVGSGCTAYVKESSTGWGVEIPGMWNRLNIQYMTPEMEWLVDRGLTADARAANGRTAAECYALGLDPEDATNDFSIVSIEMVDGKPKVEWEPKTNRWTGEEIPTVLKGAERLDGEWHEVDKASESDKAKYRFFKVVVELP